MGRLTTVIISLLCMLAGVTPIAAYTGSSELINIPSGALMSMGYVEMGTSMALHMQNNAASFPLESFFRTALSENFEYGIKVHENMITQSLHGRFMYDISTDGKIAQSWSFGMKDLGWKAPTLAGSSTQAAPVSYPVYNLFLEYSFSLLRSDLNFHAGIGRDYSNSNAIQPFFGSDLALPYGIFMFEWDGKSFNVGYKQTFGRTNMYIAFSPAPYQQVGSQTRLFSFGLSFYENILGKIVKDWEKTRESTERNIARVNTKLKVIEARSKAAMDVTSAEFLQNLEKAFIEKKLTEKTFEKDTKSVVSLGVTHMQRGLEYYYQEQFDKAMDEYKIVTSMLPNLPIGFIRLGSIQLQMGNQKEALANWEHALKLDPANEQLRNFVTNLINREKEAPTKPTGSMSEATATPNAVLPTQ